MKRTVGYNKRLLEHLKSPVGAASYLRAVSAKRDPRLFKKAVSQVLAAKAAPVGGDVPRVVSLVFKGVEAADIAVYLEEVLEKCMGLRTGGGLWENLSLFVSFYLHSPGVC